jgi:hypothetical protein
MVRSLASRFVRDLFFLDAEGEGGGTERKLYSIGQIAHLLQQYKKTHHEPGLGLADVLREMKKVDIQNQGKYYYTTSSFSSSSVEKEAAIGRHMTVVDRHSHVMRLIPLVRSVFFNVVPFLRPSATIADATLFFDRILRDRGLFSGMDDGEDADDNDETRESKERVHTWKQRGIPSNVQHIYGKYEITEGDEEGFAGVCFQNTSSDASSSFVVCIPPKKLGYQETLHILGQVRNRDATNLPTGILDPLFLTSTRKSADAAAAAAFFIECIFRFLEMTKSDDEMHWFVVASPETFMNSHNPKKK